MTRELTQVERVLAVLRRRGARGTNRLEWAGPDVVDGGPPILHLAGRIGELRDAGIRIETHAGPRRVVQYALTADPQDSGAAADELTAQASLDVLGASRPVRPALGQYDPFSEWS